MDAHKGLNHQAGRNQVNSATVERPAAPWAVFALLLALLSLPFLYDLGRLLLSSLGFISADLGA